VRGGGGIRVRGREKKKRIDCRDWRKKLYAVGDDCRGVEERENPDEPKVQGKRTGREKES